MFEFFHRKAEGTLENCTEDIWLIMFQFPSPRKVNYNRIARSDDSHGIRGTCVKMDFTHKALPVFVLVC